MLALPEDMLVEESHAADALPYAVTRVHPAAADLEQVRALLAEAERPLVVVGGAPWSAEAHVTLTAWCSAGGLPVASGWRRQDYVDNTSAACVGHSRSAPNLAWRSGCATPTSCS